MLTVNDPATNHPFLSRQGPKQLLIGGEWRDAASGTTFESLNPSDGTVLAEIAEAGPADVDLAVSAARAAFEGAWGATSPARRQKLMLDLADLVEECWEELRLLDVLEMGAPVGPDIRVTASRSSEVFRYYAGWATKIQGRTIPNSLPGSFFTYDLREPVGVVGSIIPWNGPLFTATWKIAPVLATGCTMILKPAEEASLSLLRLGELITERLGFPPGVLNILTGQGETGAAIASHAGIDKVSFTGSTVVGQEIVRAASGNLKRLSLELGGKSPDIIFADADLEKAIPGAAMGVFANSGQMCVAGSRIFVERPAYEEVVAGLARVAEGLRVGPSLSPDTQLGPVVSQQQLDRVTMYMESGKESSRLVTGGSRLTDEGLENGYFVAPTVFADVEDDARIAREEIFGPVASVLPFDDVDEVIARGNQLEYGLGGGVWTTNLSQAHRVAGGLRTGTVWVNCYSQYDPALPFGGYKMSGWGKELGEQSLEDYLTAKSVCINVG
jgi:aldehyde dehydrogenase (NAD+)